MTAHPGAKAIHARTAERVVEILWQDDSRSRLAAALLRARCRCAACQRAARHRGPASPAAYGGVGIADVRAVGSYAVQLVFTDGHDRGIFPFGYLRSLGTGEGGE